MTEGLPGKLRHWPVPGPEQDCPSQSAAARLSAREPPLRTLRASRPETHFDSEQKPNAESSVSGMELCSDLRKRENQMYLFDFIPHLKAHFNFYLAVF